MTRSGISRPAGVRVAVASVFSAAASYGVLLIAARILTPATNADFLAYWSLLLGLFGVLGGVQNETTRSVGSAAESGEPVTAVARSTTQPRGLSGGCPALPLGLAVGAGLAALLAVTSWLWADDVLGQQAGLPLLVLVLAVWSFAGHSALAGALGGLGAWSGFAALLGLEALVRIALCLAVAAGDAHLRGLEMAASAAAGAWMLLLLAPAGRRAAVARTDVAVRAYLTRVGQAVVASTSSALVVVGFPVLLLLTSSRTEFATSAPLLLAVSLTRAPLLIPLGAYQGVAVTHFLSRRTEGVRPLLRISTGLLATGLVGAAVAALVGPALMVLLFGGGYRVSGSVLGALTLAATGLALLTLTGAAVLALDRHRAYAVGWLLATAVSVLLLLLPASLTTRTVLSLSLGPAVGVAVHSWTLRRR